MWLFPLKSYNYNLPLNPHPGGFGSIRKFDIHTGIDLYCRDLDPVVAVENGVIGEIWAFTGEMAGSPWWNNTWAIGIKGNSGVVVYGEIKPCVKKGDKVIKGQIIGHVIPVLKKDKGRPMSMLHIELYKELCEPVVWELNQPMPSLLLNPSQLCIEALKNTFNKNE